MVAAGFGYACFYSRKQTSGCLWCSGWGICGKHLDIALDMDPENARKHTLKSAFQRTFIMAAVLMVSMIWYSYVHPIGVVLGLMGVKMTAYMQPYVHRFIAGVKRVG